jgi:hypothetical protein
MGLPNWLFIPPPEHVYSGVSLFLIAAPVHNNNAWNSVPPMPGWHFCFSSCRWISNYQPRQWVLFLLLAVYSGERPGLYHTGDFRPCTKTRAVISVGE